MKYHFERIRDTHKENKIIYIFTEGEGTEPIYFQYKKNEIEKEIRRKGVKIEIKGTGYNTTSLVEYALLVVNNNNIDLSIDDCWIVFDKDNHKYFNLAIKKAQRYNLKVAYSNEAFELWFLLHFNFMNSAIGRNDYNKKLTENYIKVTGDKSYKYNKTDNVLPLINIIKNKEQNAIKNAIKLLNEHGSNISFDKKNPSTTVHLLVNELNKLKI